MGKSTHNCCFPIHWQNLTPLVMNLCFYAAAQRVGQHKFWDLFLHPQANNDVVVHICSSFVAAAT